MIFRFALSAIALLALVPATARADCTTPAGVAGEQFFNTTYLVMQYCNGTDWVNMGSSSASETDPQVGTLTGTKWCVANAGGTAIDCTANAPGGADNLGNHIATQSILSDTNNTDDLGSTAVRWKDGWFAGTVTGGSFSGSGASLTSLNASNLSSGTVGTARLGSGTANSTTFLRGDGTWQAPSISETDPQVSAVTLNKWCRGTGTQVTCDQDAPSGGGGEIKAWVTFSGVSTATVNGSLNVATVVRNAVGDYTISFSTALPNANYAAVGSGRRNCCGIDSTVTIETQTATSVRIRTANGNGTFEDFSMVNLIIVQ